MPIDERPDGSLVFVNAFTHLGQRIHVPRETHSRGFRNAFASLRNAFVTLSERIHASSRTCSRPFRSQVARSRVRIHEPHDPIASLGGRVHASGQRMHASRLVDEHVSEMARRASADLVASLGNPFTSLPEPGDGASRTHERVGRSAWMSLAEPVHALPERIHESQGTDSRVSGDGFTHLRRRIHASRARIRLSRPTDPADGAISVRPQGIPR